MERVVNDEKKYRVVSLFAGIGGIDLGFDFAGFDVIWANDFDKYAVQTYKKNVSENVVCADITTITDQIPEHDVLIGGFPCQPFSTLGKLKGFEDEGRGNLFFTIIDIIKEYDTRVVVLENVKNLVNHDNGNTFKVILNEFDKAGYDVHFQVLNSVDFGVPQRRNRIFIVAFNRKYYRAAEFTFPKPQKLTVTTQDLLDEYVDESYFLTRNIAKTILSTGTKNYHANPTIDLPISKTLCATMHKMHRACQDNYVTDEKNYRRFNNPERINIRKLTPNECRKLQGFPSDWVQVVSDCQAYKQFGNAVTVNVAYAVAQAVMQFMEENQI